MPRTVAMTRCGEFGDNVLGTLTRPINIPTAMMASATEIQSKEGRGFGAAAPPAALRISGASG